MTSHSASYTQREQHRFVTSWFSDWSQFQREDFAAALAQKLQPKLYVNGLVGGLQRLGRPPSIFQCQVKLFQEWSDTWTEEQRQQLRMALVETDPAFGVMLDAALVGDEGVCEGGADTIATNGAGFEHEPELDEDGDADLPTEDASIDSQSSELTPTEI